jgi:hypothetical protein
LHHLSALFSYHNDNLTFFDYTLLEDGKATEGCMWPVEETRNYSLDAISLKETAISIANARHIG